MDRYASNIPIDIFIVLRHLWKFSSTGANVLQSSVSILLFKDKFAIMVQFPPLVPITQGGNQIALFCIMAWRRTGENHCLDQSKIFDARWHH